MSSSTQHKLRVLFVDDEPAIREVMKIELPRMGHDLTICEDGESALKVLEDSSFDAAIVDLKMPGLSGWDVVEHLKKVSPETEFIISTGHGDMKEAIRALREGAYDFLPKPCKLFEIANVLQRVGDKKALTNKAIALETRLKRAEGKTNIVGSSPGMTRVKTLIEKIAPTDSTVLILGETGTGKELVARSVHEQSLRADGPFVPVNCGALPENLIESEFFGHRKGAFTGADAPRKGLFEVAHGGTLFLDELGELDKSMQVKLLRFLESGEIRRVGENEPFNVDVRIVCATNRDLQEMAEEGTFREDLIFRVNTFEIHLPPLRERKEDIPEIALALIARHLKRDDVSREILTPEATEALINHEWTGNIRELANALEHAVILSGGEPISPEDLPRAVTRPGARPGAHAVKFSGSGKVRTLREVEMEVILDTLEKHDGDKPKTASELGIALKTLYNKLNQYQAQHQAKAG
ncbi:sigma-54-dependent transcriptional regulator [Thalassoroseus pseudoceratinae]|uniref:sigma-54-dependent transcriptional regulator n=1 Tax=Thalassoroseus pseudoceratinae TaxID=2713176 RepID=UPI00141E6AA2|nr:sigma-54 dependent transcriptional regulator [Thalassoroseus pseudoceratinae]